MANDHYLRPDDQTGWLLRSTRGPSNALRAVDLPRALHRAFTTCGIAVDVLPSSAALDGYDLVLTGGYPARFRDLLGTRPDEPGLLAIVDGLIELAGLQPVAPRAAPCRGECDRRARSILPVDREGGESPLIRGG